MEDVAIILVLLVLSFAFSGSEVAFFSLPAHRLPPKLKEQRWIADLLAFPNRLLSTILLGNTAVNAFAAAVFTLAFDRITAPLMLDPAIQALLDVFTFTLIVLVFGEVTPKTLAFHRPLTFARLAVYLLYPLSFLLKPLTIPLGKVLVWLTGRLHLQSPEGSPFLELEQVLRVAQEMRSLKRGEVALFRDVFQLVRLKAWDIMTPREEVKALPHTARVQDALRLLHQTHHSKFPVYRESLDQVIGIFDVAVIPERGLSPAAPVQDYLEKPLFVLESTGLLELYLKLQGHGPQMAVVVDELGNMVGIVTPHDLVKGLAGVLRAGGEEPLLMKRIDARTWIIWGDIPLWELEEFLGLPVEREEEPATLGGLIMERLGHVPQEGEKFVYRGFLFEVLEVEGNRVGAVKVQRIET